MSMIEQEIKDVLFNTVDGQQLLSGIKIRRDDIRVERAKSEFGDWSSNIAFIIASKINKNPQEVAMEIVNLLPHVVGCEQPEVFNGYINYKISDKLWHLELDKILKQKERYADSKKQKEKIQIEFISANPTGPLTLANGRGGFLGDVLANLFQKAGYEVEREYYVNDGGNQVKILGESLLHMDEIRKDIDKNDLYKGDYLLDILGIYKNKKKYAEWSKTISPSEYGEKAAKDLLEGFIKPSVKTMNIQFDNWFSEKEMIERGEVDEVIEKLKEYKLTEEKDGALWMKTTRFGDDKDRVLIKADGEKTYFADDVAYHWDKFSKRKFDKVIDIWGADHHGYIGRMKAATEAMGYKGQLDIIITQMVRLVKNGELYKMSKRKGVIVTVDGLLELIGGSGREASDVARFFFLSRSASTHMDFDLDLAKDQSEKNPVYYVKYAYARISGILRNAEKLELSKANLSLLKEKEEINLIKELIKLSEVINKVISGKDYPVHELTFYARDIASKFHQFYDKCRVIDEDDLELSAARLRLVEATKIVMSIVMKDLLGIDTPDKM